MNVKSAKKLRLLMLTHRFPWPPNRGDRIRSWNILKKLSSIFSVTLASQTDEPVSASQLAAVNELCEDTLIVAPSKLHRVIHATRHILQGKSITEGIFYSKTLGPRIKRTHQLKPFDAIFVFCSSMFQHIDLSCLDGLNTVVDLVDVDSKKWEQMAIEAAQPKRTIYKRESRLIRKLERKISQHANAVTVVSDNEKQILAQSIGHTSRASVHAIGNGVDTDYFAPCPQRYDENPSNLQLVFTGVLNYHPNVAGLDWFCRKVLPNLQKRSDVKIQIVGKSPTDRIKSLNHIHGVEVVGEVPDVRPYLESADIAISPLGLARGIQNKVLEAMAMQLPVICSSPSAEGIDAADGVHLMVADTIDQWLQAIDSLRNNTKRRNEIATAARMLVIKKHAWPQRLEPLIELLTPKTRVATNA